MAHLRMSQSQFDIGMPLDWARELLEKTGMAVTDVTVAHLFGSALQFSRAKRAKSAVSPKDERIEARARRGPKRLSMPVDRDVLARKACARSGGQEQDGVGNILRREEGLARHVFGHAAAQFDLRLSGLGGFRGNHASYALARHQTQTRADVVDPHAMRAEFLCQGAGQTPNRPFRGGINIADENRGTREL